MFKPEKFPAELSELSDSLSMRSDYANELFLYYLVPKIESKYLGAAVGDVTLNGGRYKALDFCKKIYVFFTIMLLMIITFPIVYLIGLYVLIFNISSNSFTEEYLGVIRTPASLSKIKNQVMVEKYFMLVDDLSYRGTGLYSMYKQSLFTHFSILVRLLVSLVKDMSSLFHDLSLLSSVIPIHKAFYFLMLRVPFKVVYQEYLKATLLKRNCNVFLTGNKDDRYAMLEKRVCKELKIKSVCIPHGLEYGFKMPGGVVGDVFYCTSEKSRKELSKLYKEQEFVFCEITAKHMFSSSSPNEHSEKMPKIVFFPESRDIDINKFIIHELQAMGLNFYIKLHPSDSFKNYQEYISDDKLICSLSDALNGNVCLARRSTVLLESIYNNGVACAVLLDRKDELYVDYVFPSLSNEKVNVARDVSQLRKFLEAL